LEGFLTLLNVLLLILICSCFSVSRFLFVFCKLRIGFDIHDSLCTWLYCYFLFFVLPFVFNFLIAVNLLFFLFMLFYYLFFFNYYSIPLLLLRSSFYIPPSFLLHSHSSTTVEYKMSKINQILFFIENQSAFVRLSQITHFLVK
jgi:hypothetical protein